MYKNCYTTPDKTAENTQLIFLTELPTLPSHPKADLLTLVSVIDLSLYVLDTAAEFALLRNSKTSPFAYRCWWLMCFV